MYLIRCLLVLSAVCLCWSVQANSIDVSKPESLTFGASVADIQHRLQSLCSSMVMRSIEPITAPLAQQSQTQIDCSGFDFAGGKRDIELVFQDDQLDLVWILFPEEEKGFFIDAFTAQYGKPSFLIDFGTIYLQANAAVRNRPAEVLFVSSRQLQAMLAMLQK